MKVYCKDCKYLIEWSIALLDKSCNNSNNIKDNFYQPKYTMSLHPSEINKNNDCKWYKAK